MQMQQKPASHAAQRQDATSQEKAGRCLRKIADGSHVGYACQQKSPISF